MPDSHCESIAVKNVTLNQLLETHSLKSPTLICDIEGAEIQIILEDTEALKSCQQIIIELHPTTYKGIAYSQKTLSELIQARGFRWIDQEGHVHVFEKY